MRIDNICTIDNIGLFGRGVTCDMFALAHQNARQLRELGRPI